MANLIPNVKDGKPTGTFVFTCPDPEASGGAYIAEGHLEIPDVPMPVKGMRYEFPVTFVVET